MHVLALAHHHAALFHFSFMTLLVGVLVGFVGCFALEHRK